VFHALTAGTPHAAASTFGRYKHRQGTYLEQQLFQLVPELQGYFDANHSNPPRSQHAKTVDSALSLHGSGQGHNSHACIFGAGSPYNGYWDQNGASVSGMP